MRGLGRIIGSRAGAIDTAQDVKRTKTKARLSECYRMAEWFIVEGIVNSVACGSATDNGTWDYTFEEDACKSCKRVHSLLMGLEFRSLYHLDYKGGLPTSITSLMH